MAGHKIFVVGFASVSNMQQITKAMKMVPASKLRRAQSELIAARPYDRQLQAVP